MRIRSTVVAGASIAVALMGLLPAAAIAQPTPPSKPGASAPHDPAPADDLFAPPMRGTPGGRISGGTRGLGHPTPAPPPARPPTPGSASRATPDPLITIGQ